MATQTDSSAEEKSKNRAKGGGEHKRKYEEEEEIEVAAVQELTKKEKKKKKKKKNNKENQEQEIIETPNGLDEEIKNKKKRKDKKEKKEEILSNGSEEKVNGGGEVRESANEGVTVSGKDVNELKYKAMKSFSESRLPDKVMECCKNFDKPSPIQSNSWPFLLNGRDFIGIAKTSKTLPFGIPMMMHILSKRKDKSSKNPLCLVLSPRELAQQIFDVLSDAGKPSSIRSVCVYGGTSKGPQKSALRSGVVLDEADRMLDMGFEQEVRSILSATSSIRQMVMFSATWPLAVNQLSQEFMDPNPVKVVVGSEDLAANHDVMQIVEVLEDRARDERLVNLLEKYHKSRRNRVLVFVLYKEEEA